MIQLGIISKLLDVDISIPIMMSPSFSFIWLILHFLLMLGREKT